jgi:glycosyltransferase involved in cell wall biosynthesis
MTSIIVPCHSTHAKYLPDLLCHLKNQTVLPDEVVIAISDADSISDDIILCLNQENHPFKVIPIYSKGIVSAGGNRNIACSNAKGHILICNDADDIPHPQRIEVIKYFFEKYEIDLLVHDFFREEKDYKAFNLNQIKCFDYVSNYKRISHHRGCPAISKNVFNSIIWDEKNFNANEDKIFVETVGKKFKNSYIIDAKIYRYRQELSSFPFEHS